MNKALEILKLVATLIPAIIAAVKAIEEALPDKGQGAEKLALVRAMIEQSFATVQGVSITFAEVWPTIQTAIAGFVALFNKLGQFRK